MISSKTRTQQKKVNYIIKYSNYILLISTLSVIYGSASHQTEFLTIGLLFFAGLIFTQKENIKRLEFDKLSKQLDIENLEGKVRDFEDIIEVFQDNHNSIIDEYEPKQTETPLNKMK